MIVKRCGCGRRYTLEQWNQLPFLGMQKDSEDVPRYQARNCPCTSTICLDVNSIHIVLVDEMFSARRSDGSTLRMVALSQDQLVKRIREFFTDWDIYDPDGGLVP